MGNTLVVACNTYFNTLASSLNHKHPPTYAHTRPPGAGYDLERYRPVVLVSCGSFNPPTFMHLRMLELAQQQMAKVGWGVRCSAMPQPPLLTAH